MRILTAVFVALIGSLLVSAQTYTISTFAGGGIGDGGPATTAIISNPGSGLAMDLSGNLYIADTGNNRIRKVAAASGIISTVAGDGTYGYNGDGGPAINASLAAPGGVAVDSAGNLYIADTNNNRVRKVDAVTGIISTVAGAGNAYNSRYNGDGSAATGASLTPAGVAVDPAGNLYIADAGDNAIRKVTAATGIITSVVATGDSLYKANGAALDTSGNIYVVDSDAAVIRKVAATTGIVTIVAGNGTLGFSGDGGAATSASFDLPTGLAVDSSGNIYIADAGNERIRKVTAATGIITTVAGSGMRSGLLGDGGAASSASFYNPTGVAVDSSGNIYIADYGDQSIRKVTAATGIITTVAGECCGVIDDGDGGPATSAYLAETYGVAFDVSGNLYIAEFNGERIRQVAATTGIIETVAGDGMYGDTGDGGAATSASLGQPSGIAVDSSSNFYITELYGNRVRKVAAATGIITTVAGNGKASFSGDGGAATSAGLNSPNGVAVDASGNLYIADFLNNRIRRVAAAGGIITTVAGGGTSGLSGDGGPATSASFGGPNGVAVDASGDLYISDYGNNRIRKVTAATGIITTVAGSGPLGAIGIPISGDGGAAISATLFRPTGVAVDASGNLYISDAGNRVRKVAAATGIITTIAGNGMLAFGGDGGAATSADLLPAGLTTDSRGNIYVADTTNNRVRLLTFSDAAPVALTSLSPPSATTAGPAFTLTINGSGFLFGATVQWNGSVLASAFVSATQLTASVPAALIAAAGSATILVVNPTGVSSNPIAIPVDDPVPAITSISPMSAIAAGPSFTLTVNGTGFLSRTAVLWNGSALETSFVSATQLTAFVPASLIAAAGSASILPANAGEPSYSAATFSVQVPAPAITPDGVVPIYSTIPVIQPGSWVSIYGVDFAAATSTWNGDFPTSLGGVTVTIDNIPAYLWIVSPTQINLQAPDDSTIGPVSVVVKNPSGTATSTVNLAPQGPSFSLLGDGKHVAAEIATPSGAGAYGDGTYDLVGPSGAFSFNTRPVNPGETLVLFGVGFGPTSPPVLAGRVFYGAAATTNRVSITIGGVNANVAFSGITEAGLYQINVTIPNAPSGDQPLLAVVNGVQTPAGPVVTVQ
jgi:uncharacterized protein (TIGR03437 family)